MATTLIDTGRRAGDFIAGESNFWRSRDHVMIPQGLKLEVGTVLAQSAAPNASGLLLVSPKTGNTGNGTATPDATAPVAVGARPGTYIATLTTAAANGGTFTVVDPMGDTVGTVAVGATFNNQIKFVIADGSTDFVLGDAFNFTVERQDGLFVQLNPGGSGGAEVAKGFLFDKVDSTNGPVRAVALTRSMEADDKRLTWPAGITATQKATAVTQLASAGIVVRTR